MKIKLLSVAVLVLALFGLTAQTSAYYTCETLKEEGCYANVDYPFVVRQTPTSVGNYDTNGGYPAWLADAPQYTYQDYCGFENRTSESYAWYRFYGYGGGFHCAFVDISVDQWVADAQGKEGYVFSDTPRVGAIAITKMGPRGHAAYVEELLDNGKIRISQYDLVPGAYSESVIQSKNAQYLVGVPFRQRGD